MRGERCPVGPRKEDPVRRTHGILLPAVAVALGGALSIPVANAQPAARTTPVVVTGTICRIDTAAGTIELLMGVGHAIRVERIRFQPGVPVKSRGASAAVSALTPGVVCRVECSYMDAHENATAIEVLTPPEVHK